MVSKPHGFRADRAQPRFDTSATTCRHIAACAALPAPRFFHRRGSSGNWPASQMAGPFSGAGRRMTRQLENREVNAGAGGKQWGPPALGQARTRRRRRAWRPKGGDGAPNSRIAGPIRRRSTSHCLAPGSQTPLPYASAHRIGAGTAP